MSDSSKDENAACYCPCARPGPHGENPAPSLPSSFRPDGPSSSGPTYPAYWGSIKQLYCRTRYNLAIDPNGRVYGTPEAYHPHAKLHFNSVAPGEVQMRGIVSGLFLAMNREGHLYGEANVKEEGTIFVESYDRNSGYNTYLSRKYAHFGWYVGIKKSGKPKPGPKTAYGQKAVMFLPREVAPSGTN